MELKENVFYVYDRFDEEDEDSLDYVFAKYSPKYDRFYDFRYENVYGDEEVYNLSIGQKVIHQYGGWDMFDENIDLNIVNKAKIHKAKRKELETKHPDLWPVEEEPPKTKDLLLEYFSKKIDDGENIDFYIIGIIELLTKAMDIRVRHRHGGSFYSQLGLDYPEDVFDTFDALYSIVKKRLENIHPGDQIKCHFYRNARKFTPTKELYDELGERTGFNFDCEVNNKLSSIEYHSSPNSDIYKIVSERKPTVCISKDFTVYDSGINLINYVPEKITPEICREKYLGILSNGGAKVFQKTKNE